jgi:hypothetical protein
MMGDIFILLTGAISLDILANLGLGFWLKILILRFSSGLISL